MLTHEIHELTSAINRMKPTEPQIKELRKSWNRCDICHRFIALADFLSGRAKRTMVTPDSDYSTEDYETLCPIHVNGPTPKKGCEVCGKTIAKHRRFCSLKCFGKTLMVDGVALRTEHRRAERMFPGNQCQHCGKVGKMDRHHKDKNPRNNAPDNVMILCRACHAKEHSENDNWGSGRTIADKECPACHKMFRPVNCQQVSCQNPECTRILLTRNAYKYLPRLKGKVCPL